MSKFMTMYGANKPSTFINDTRWGGIIFRENPVRSDMPNNNIPSKIYIIMIKIIPSFVRSFVHCNITFEDRLSIKQMKKLIFA